MTAAPPLLSVDRLAVSKDYLFLTFQGEGPRLGQRTLFLRLAGCNLSCSWCDTPYTWDWARWDIHNEVTQKSIYQLAEDIDSFDCQSLTITGGEPLLQAKALNILFSKIDPRWEEINFETNGTVFPSWNVIGRKINYVVSPKLSNSGRNPALEPTVKPEAWPHFEAYEPHVTILQAFVEAGADFKFVCETPEDLDEVAEVLSCIAMPSLRFPYRLPQVPKNKVWIMPQGVDPAIIDQRARLLAPEVLNRGWNLTTRYHMHLWGNERAR
jgi:7-carboxy-7-deazaguanine synthase